MFAPIRHTGLVDFLPAAVQPKRAPLLPPTPPGKPLIAARRYALSQTFGNAIWFADNVRRKPRHTIAASLPGAVAHMRLHLALEEHARLRPTTAPGTPQGNLARTAYDYAQELREDLVYARHLVQAAPEALKQGALKMAEPVQTLLRGGPQAQALVQDIKHGVSLLLNDFDAVSTTLGHAVAQEQENIAQLKHSGRLDEAAQQELGLYLNALAMAVPGVGMLWASGRVALAAGQVARVVGRLPKMQGSIDKVVRAASRHRAGFAKTIKAGTFVTAAGTVAATAINGDAVHIYFDRRNPLSGHSIPTTLYGAPRDVTALTIKVGPMSASVWGGTNVTVGNPIGTAELRRAGKRKRAQNQMVNEQHQTGLLLGAGVRYGTHHTAAYASRMLHLFNVTTTARADPTQEGKAPTRLATQADISWIYYNSTDALALGPVALKARHTKKGKHAAGGLANDGHAKLGSTKGRESKYITANANPAFGKAALERHTPILSIDPLRWVLKQSRNP